MTCFSVSCLPCLFSFLAWSTRVLHQLLTRLKSLEEFYRSTVVMFSMFSIGEIYFTLVLQPLKSCSSFDELSLLDQCSSPIRNPGRSMFSYFTYNYFKSCISVCMHTFQSCSFGEVEASSAYIWNMIDPVASSAFLHPFHLLLVHSKNRSFDILENAPLLKCNQLSCREVQQRQFILYFGLQRFYKPGH